MSEPACLLAHLECRACCTVVAADRPVGMCPTCGHTLFATYHLDRLDGKSWREEVARRPATLWRYRELLPVEHATAISTLGEGFSPILDLGEVPEAPGVRVSLKDDGGLPTGSFKARGMAVAVSRARELGLKDLYVPSAGNAGVALAAYSARARLRARVYLPVETPAVMQQQCRQYGAEVVTVPGTIREAGTAARTAEQGTGGFDMSTLREPYRVEGKKTMGFEIRERFGADGMPDVIVYPTGGGTGLVGLWKGFQELRSLGLLEQAPRLVAVQSETCAPVVRALRDGSARVTPWTDARTVAPGLLVPAPFSSERVLEAVRATHGAGVSVSDEQILAAQGELARRFGLSVAREAAAPWAALPELASSGAVRSGERVLLYLTGRAA